ncbi:hypothetical protein OROGR_010800 [Orobanche gracilis]
MASRCRTVARSTTNLLKSTITKPSSRSAFSIQPTRSSPSLISRDSGSIFRPPPQMGALMSLLPLHTAVSSARLTSCLGPDNNGCRSLSQGSMN